MTWSPKWRAAGPGGHSGEGGFTLIEVMVSVVILALIIGAVSAALITVLDLSGSTTKSITNSADAQVVSANLTNDVQSAAQITTHTYMPKPLATRLQCGTGAQLLGLEWNQVPGQSSFDTVVSYLAVQQGTSWTLVRDECLAGYSTTPASSDVVSYDICQPELVLPPATSCTSPGQQAPTIKPATKNTAAAGGWVSSEGVTGVRFSITEPQSHYTYTLVATPIAGNPSTAGGSVAPPGSTCGYATPGTGTYAQTLCFVNFATYKWATAAYTGGGCQTFTEGITGTPFSLSFCLKVQAGTESNKEAPPTSWTTACHYGAGAGSGGVPIPPNPPASPCLDKPSADIVAVPLPTYTNPPSSEAFLGNNGFYTGVPGDPALYTYLEGTAATLYLTTIKVLDQNGNPATSWQLVTGDAESTDPGESITWSTCPATSGGGVQTSCAGAPNLSLIRNNQYPTDFYGNACPNTNYTNNTTNTWLRSGSLVAGQGQPFQHNSAAQEVECAAGVSTDKTGTVMLEAPQPTSLTVNMVGSGLQAIFLGFLL